MLHIHSFNIVVTLFLCCTSIVDAIVLQDLPHLSVNGRPVGAPRLVSRQEDCGMLSLRSAESFLWGGLSLSFTPCGYADQCSGEDGSSAVFGNLTVHFPGDEENIVSMQRFQGMTKSVTCRNNTNSMEIAFQNDKTFQCAKNLWDWVNGADNHTFVMVAGTGDCGWNDRRVPFIVSTIQYDEEANTAHLGAKASEWSTTAHSYELHVGTLEPQSSTTRRSIFDPAMRVNQNTSMDFEHKVPDVALTFPAVSDLSVTFACVECKTHGSFQFAFHLETQFFGLKKASVSFSPRGVNMDINSKVTFSDSLVGKKRFAEDLIAIPLGGITIEDIVDLGPEIVFQAGVDVGPLTASTTFTSGVSLSLEDSAQMTLDLLGSSVTSDGWTPTVSQKPLSVDAKITGEVKAFLKARIQLSATVLGFGYTAGVGLSPYVSANLSALASDTGACADDVQKHAFGVSAGAYFGVEVKAEIEDNGQPLLEKVLWVSWMRSITNRRFGA